MLSLAATILHEDELAPPMQHHGAAQPRQNQTLSTLQRNKAADYDTADSIFDDSIPSGVGDYHGLDVDDFILYVPVTNEIPVTV